MPQPNEGPAIVLVGSAESHACELASALAKRGARVVLAVLGGPATKNDALAAVHSLPAELDEDAVNGLFDHALEVCPSVAALVHVSSSTLNVPLKDVTRAQWQQHLAFNIRNAFLCTQRMVEELICSDDGGRIVYLSQGTLAAEPDPSSTTALRTLSRCVAKEYGHKKVLSNLVIARAGAPVPLLARWVEFYVSSASSYVSGESAVVEASV